MKKITLALALAMLAGFASADDYFWNFTWKIDGALSPDHDAADLVPVLQDYSVTWSLLNASDGSIIDSYDIPKGTTEQWGHGLFDEYMSPNTDATYIKLTTDYTTSQDLYQYIRITNGTDVYDWTGDVLSVAPTTDTTVPGPTIKGNSELIGDTVAWHKVDPTGVPEPATMSLLGLGALVMVLRRKLRK